MSYSISMSAAVIPGYSLKDIFTHKGKIRSKEFTEPARRNIWIDQISPGLFFREYTVIPYRREEGYYTAQFNIEDLIIASAEENFDAMAEDMKNQIADAWEYYAKEKDCNLTPGARRVKTWLLDNLYEG